MSATSKTVEPQIPSEDWVSLVEAARLLGETRQTVLARAVKREIVADHIAGRTVVSRASIERFLAQRSASVA